MIVIPMAGMSQRFFDAGYKKPKYMLEAHGKTMFEHSVESFNRYFSSEVFLFIVRDVFNTPDFVKLKAASLGIKNFHISILNEATRGQAETVYLGLEKLRERGIQISRSITIFNIDTIRNGFTYPENIDCCDGYLEVFRGSGDNWSFVEIESAGLPKVVRTTEKEPISDLCSTGLYHFKNLGDYYDAYEEYLSYPQEKWAKGELYIAPLYNVLIKKGCYITCDIIDKHEVVFCGVPCEYVEFCR